MSPFLRYLVVVFSVVAAAAQTAQAQQNTPHVGYVYPAGGRQGETFEITVGGQYLDRESDATISGGGVHATLVEHPVTLTTREVNDLREKVQELRKKPRAAEITKQIAEINAKLNENQNRRLYPVLADKTTFQVSIAPDAEPGRRELRVMTEMGLSNPLAFHVGQLPEFRESKPKSSGELPIDQRPRDPNEPQRGVPEVETEVSLPATVNGQITPGDVDRFRFHARKGQRLVAVVRARELMPYLADAVPGWFQAAVAIYDSKGNVLAYDDHYRFDPDPVLHCKIPKDGQYVLEVRDTLYRGRDDFVYRIDLGELPFITSVFPLGGPVGAQTTVELKGWNLPFEKLSVDAKAGGPKNLPISVQKGKAISNRVPFEVDNIAECLEQEPNNQPAEAQAIVLPMIVNGRIDRPDDWDVFRFHGHAGEEIVAEVHARRLDSPLDSVLKLTDAAGKQLAFNDDNGDKATGLSTHHADSRIAIKLPADGVYYLHLSDVQHKGGAEYAYRLHIAPPRPDFALRVAPSGVNVRAGGTAALTVHALRRDGFSGAIALVVKGLPKGFVVPLAKVPADKDQVKITLRAPQALLEEPVSITIEGRATIGGREFLRTAVPAEDMMQAFIYRHLVPAKNLMVAVIGGGWPPNALKYVGERPVKLPSGEATPLRFTLARGTRLEPMQLVLRNPPDGITIENVSIAEDSVTLLLRAEGRRTKAGMKGYATIDAFRERAADPKDGKQQAAVRRVLLGTLPGMQYEIVEPQ